MITDLKIRNFLLLSEELNFSRAAQRLYVSQQALSAQISSLETDLGFPLFIRTTKSVRLTEAGAAVADFFRRSNAEFQALTAAYRQEAVTLLRIGCFENLDIGSLLFQARDAVADLYPHLSCQMSACGSYNALFQRLEERTIDIAVLPLGIEPPASCCTQVLADDVTYAFFSPRMPGADRIHSLNDLKDALLFAGPEFNGLWQYLHDYFQRQGIKAEFDYDSGSSVIMERMIIESGEGVGFGGRYSLLYRNPQLRRIPVELTGQLGAVWRKDSSNPVIRPYLKALAKAF